MTTHDLPCTQHDAYLPLDLLQTVRSGNGQQMNIVSRQGSTKKLLRTELRALRVTLDVEEVLSEVRISDKEMSINDITNNGFVNTCMDSSELGRPCLLSEERRL